MSSKKFLDKAGVKILWRELSLQDYPKNETLMAVIEAIDETKADKSDIVQSNWNQNDAAAKDYIKNRPFGEEVVSSDTLTWDGNTEGLESFWANEDAEAFLITEAVPTVEQLEQANWMYRILPKHVSGGTLDDRVSVGEFQLDENAYNEPYKCVNGPSFILQLEDINIDVTELMLKIQYWQSMSFSHL